MNVRWWQERLYPELTSRDPVQRFLRTLEGYLHPSQEVLDLGAGTGAQNAYQLKGKVKRLVGVDLDTRVRDNPLLDEGVVGDVSHLPFADNRFDLAFSIYVLEHIHDPRAFVAEIGRVLKPGGYFLALTPNFYHYVPLIAALTTTRFHKWLNKRRGRPEDDTFPTCYRMNSRKALKRHLGGAGFEVVRFDMIEVQPNYLMFSTPTFLLGAVYERIVNATDWLALFRVNIIGIFRKCAE